MKKQNYEKFEDMYFEPMQYYRVRLDRKDENPEIIYCDGENFFRIGNVKSFPLTYFSESEFLKV